MRLGERGKICGSFLVLICVMSSVLSAQDQENTLSSTISASRISLHDRLVLTVTATGPSRFKEYYPRLFPTPEFSTIWAYTTVQLHSQNKNLQCTIVQTYQLIPLKTGTFTVGKTNWVRSFNEGNSVEVVDGPPLLKPDKLQTNHTFPGDDRYIFVTSSVNKKDPYVGEQVLFELTHFDNIYNTDTNYTAPPVAGFWSVEMPGVMEKSIRIKGEQCWFNVYRIALFPATSGDLVIGSANLTYSSVKGLITQWGQLISEPIVLHIRPLPENDRPSSFAGAVGKFSITASVQPTELDADNEVTVTVTLTGQGNLGLVSSLTEPDLSAFRTYGPHVSEDITKNGLTVGGTKTWNYSLVPPKEGSYTVGSFALSYFNPRDKCYHTVSTKPVTLTVSPGTAVKEHSVIPQDIQEDIAHIASDIRYIKPDKSVLENSGKNPRTFHFIFLLYIVPCAVFFISYGAKRRHDRIISDRSMQRKRTALKRATKRLDDASHLIGQNDMKGFYRTIHETITGYIEDIFTIDTVMTVPAELEDIIIRHGAAPELAERIRTIIEICDFNVFSSSFDNSVNPENVIRDTVQIISMLKNIH
ncbi:BatD family protein [bacterium]|nr:BatD family protein [bacterium]